MKFIIDLIEDIREQIIDEEEYSLFTALLKEDKENSNKLIYSGEAPLNLWSINKDKKELLFDINPKKPIINLKTFVPSLLILDMDSMMYELKIDVNSEYKNMEVIGFGKNEEEKRYILFIKI